MKESNINRYGKLLIALVLTVPCLYFKNGFTFILAYIILIPIVIYYSIFYYVIELMSHNNPRIKNLNQDDWFNIFLVVYYGSFIIYAILKYLHNLFQFKKSVRKMPIKAICSPYKVVNFVSTRETFTFVLKSLRRDKFNLPYSYLL